MHTFWHLVRFQSSNFCNSLYAKKIRQTNTVKIDWYLAQVLKTTIPCYSKNLDFSIQSTLVSILTRLNLRSLYPTKKRLTPSHQRWRWMIYLRTKILLLVTCSSFLCSCYEHLPNTANSKKFFQKLVIPVFFACRRTKSNKFHWYNELYYLKSSISLLHIIIDVVNQSRTVAFFLACDGLLWSI